MGLKTRGVFNDVYIRIKNSGLAKDKQRLIITVVMTLHGLRRSLQFIPQPRSAFGPARLIHPRIYMVVT